MPGIFSIEAPHAVRTVEAIAPTMLLAAIGICHAGGDDKYAKTTDMDDGRRTTRSIVYRLSSFVISSRDQIAPALIGIGLLIAALALNGARYFVAWPASPQAYEEFFVAETHAGELIQRLAAQPEIQAGSYQIYVPADAIKTDVLRYLTSGIALETFAHSRLSTPAGDNALLIDIGEQSRRPASPTPGAGRWRGAAWQRADLAAQRQARMDDLRARPCGSPGCRARFGILMQCY